MSRGTTIRPVRLTWHGLDPWQAGLKKIFAMPSARTARIQLKEG
jgi:hypothetical protein